MSKEYYKILNITSLGVNDESATVVEWLHNDGDGINKGDIVAILETTKATFDILSESNGYLIKLKKEGEEVTISDPMALIIDNKEELETIKQNYFNEMIKENTGSIKITKKAQELASANNINIAEFSSLHKKVIREKDIRDQININKSKLVSVDDISMIGKINKDFLSELETDETFPTLSSAEKIILYKKNGAVIDANVEIGSGSVILSEYLHLKKDSIIGPNCYIKTISFELGIMSVIGNNANIVTRHVKIGDVFFSGNSIIVGGGGAFSNRAKLIVGDECLVSSYCILNTGEAIIIGSRVGLSPNVKLFTHNHWQSELEGYYSNFGPIILEDNVYVTGDCLVVPNVKIGEGSTIFANSTVINNVEPYTQLSGNPAKVVGKINKNVSKDKKISIIKRLVASMYKEEQIKDINENNVIFLNNISQKTKTDAQVLISFKVDKNCEKLKNKVIFNLQTFEVIGKENSLSDEVRNYFRKRGIRFKPMYWRYTADKGLYND
jgi:acetyltransferase-like isoleucine patch superfamily enzyme